MVVTKRCDCTGNCCTTASVVSRDARIRPRLEWLRLQSEILGTCRRLSQAVPIMAQIAKRNHSHAVLPQYTSRLQYAKA